MFKKLILARRGLSIASFAFFAALAGGARRGGGAPPPGAFRNSPFWNIGQRGVVWVGRSNLGRLDILGVVKTELN